MEKRGTLIDGLDLNVGQELEYVQKVLKKTISLFLAINIVFVEKYFFFVIHTAIIDKHTISPLRPLFSDLLYIEDIFYSLFLCEYILPLLAL